MFDYIKGILAHKNGINDVSATIENNNIGYLININNKDFSQLPPLNSEVKLYTILIHREDNMSLCGFLTRENRDIFKILTSVSGVGAKMAMMLLEEFEACELISLVIKGDFKELTRAKGVGPKLAQKIILELKDKLINLQGKVAPTIIEDAEPETNQAILDAQTVLISLGYEKEEIKKALTSSLSIINDKNNAEEILKETLKILSL